MNSRSNTPVPVPPNSIGVSVSTEHPDRFGLAMKDDDGQVYFHEFSIQRSGNKQHVYLDNVLVAVIGTFTRDVTPAASRPLPPPKPNPVTPFGKVEDRTPISPDECRYMIECLMNSYGKIKAEGTGKVTR